MPKSDIKIRAFFGSAIEPYIPNIAGLRLEIFRDYPYLYTADLEEEIDRLKKYTRTHDSIVVLVFDRSEIVGASTGIPLEMEDKEIQKPFKDKKYPIPSLYYFSESMLLKPYRGRGIGHHFFDEREAHVANLEKYSKICFSCIKRPERDSHRPKDYIPLDDFWRRRGYIKHAEMIAPFPRKSAQKQPHAAKELIFWMRDLF